MLRILLVVSAFILFASPAMAIRDTPPEPGLHYRVSDRAYGEVEIKASPSVVGETIATVDDTARDIVVTGRVSVGAGRLWWEVVSPKPGTATGWTASRFLVPAGNTAEHATDYALACNGSEPVWGLATAEGRARFAPGEKKQTDWTAGKWLPARGQKGRFVVPLMSPAAEGGTGFLVVSRAPQYCRVPAENLQYPFDATLIAPDGTVFGGCCYRAG